MRFIEMLKADMRFQRKSGFYLLYGILTVLYILVIAAIPEKFRQTAALVLIFTDPAAMGLFFMGAIVLFEKSQHLHSAFFVSPLSVGEYVMSKAVSLGILALCVAVVLGLTAKIENIPMLIMGTFLAELLFSLAGLLAASCISSLNQFLLATIPVELVGFVPILLYLFGVEKKWMAAFPSVVCFRMIMNESVSTASVLLLLLVLVGLCAVTIWGVKRMWSQACGSSQTMSNQF